MSNTDIIFLSLKYGKEGFETNLLIAINIIVAQYCCYLIKLILTYSGIYVFSSFLGSLKT